MFNWIFKPNVIPEEGRFDITIQLSPKVIVHLSWKIIQTQALSVLLCLIKSCHLRLITASANSKVIFLGGIHPLVKEARLTSVSVLTPDILPNFNLFKQGQECLYKFYSNSSWNFLLIISIYSTFSLPLQKKANLLCHKNRHYFFGWGFLFFLLLVSKLNLK